MTTSFDEPTLVRTLVQWSLNGVQSAAGDYSAFFAMGLIQLKAEGLSTPFTTAQLQTLPWPYWDGDSDWIWHRFLPFTVHTGNVHFAYANLPGSGAEDIRTKRKFQNGTGLALIVYADIRTVNTQTQWYHWSARTLWLNR